MARGGNWRSEDDGHRPWLEEREPLWLEYGSRSGNRDGNTVQVRGVVGDEDVGAVGIQLRVAPDDHARTRDAQETARPGAKHALGELRLAGDPDRGRRDHRIGQNPGPAQHRAQESEGDHGALRAAGYSSAAGKSRTSAMVSTPVSSISSR